MRLHVQSRHYQLNAMFINYLPFTSLLAEVALCIFIMVHVRFFKVRFLRVHARMILYITTFIITYITHQNTYMHENTHSALIN